MSSNIKQMGRHAPDREFLAEVSQKLREALRCRDVAARCSGKRYTRADAAKELGVSRASLQFYLAGDHMPSTDVLRRAMDIWGIELTYRQRKLTVIDLESTVQKSAGPSVKPVQLSLWDSIKRLENGALTVRVEKKSPQSLTLQLEIGFAEAV